MSCGPYTEPVGFYSTFRCKTSPAISSVGPLLAGSAKVVGAGGNIVVNGVGFGATQCSSCGLTASGAALQVSSWSDTSITAALPASVTGFVPIGLATASGSDVVNIMAAAGGAVSSIVIKGVTNSASGTVGPLAPGEVVSIYGSNMGPANGVSFTVDPATGGVDTTLAGTRVLFGSVAAPIIYASSGQINAVVPYEMAGQTQATMQVQYQSGTASQTVPIASASPGAFTLDSSGSGQAAALNLPDYSINGPSHPAPKGSYVAIYFTGGGQTNPPGVTGSVTGLVYKWLTQPISVMVGNEPAMVGFDGTAPTYVDGLDQLNIQLSPNTPSGTQPVVITVGGVSSPTTATITVQ